MKSRSNTVPIVFGLLGLGYFLYKEVVPQLVEDYANNIGVTFRKVRIKWAGLTQPTSFNFLFDLDVRNDNAIGGQVKGFIGKLLLGRTDGYDLGNLNIAPFNLAANTTTEVEVALQIDLLVAGPQIYEAIKAEDYFKKLWIIGKLDTTFGMVDIKQEVSIFYD